MVAMGCTVESIKETIEQVTNDKTTPSLFVRILLRSFFPLYITLVPPHSQNLNKFVRQSSRLPGCRMVALSGGGFLHCALLLLAVTFYLRDTGFFSMTTERQGPSVEKPSALFSASPPSSSASSSSSSPLSLSSSQYSPPEGGNRLEVRYCQS